MAAIGCTVGIPRGLFFYLYYDICRSFFERLGVIAVPSCETTKPILDEGLRTCVDEACLPVKLFHGHVLDLAGRVDYLLIPRITSICRREYVCPKMAALPDMVRSSLKGLPPMIDCEINLWKNGRGIRQFFVDIARYLGFRDGEAKAAFREAISQCGGGINSDCGDIGASGLKIGIVGHIYNLSDPYLNMDLLRKLSSYGIKAVTAAPANPSVNRRSNGDERRVCRHKEARACEKRIFWQFGNDAMEMADELVFNEKVDGMIYVMSFGCGVDSFISYIIGQHLKKSSGIPLMMMVVDEHSGDAGVETRIEAFADLIVRHGKASQA